MLGFQWLSFRMRGWVVLCFRPGLGDDVLWYLPCSSVCGLHCTSSTNARQSQWETVISCAGGQVFLVRLGGTSSAMRAVRVATVCNVKVRSSISISFWLRMPWSRGCWLSVTKRSVLCPLGSVHSCCCSVSSLEERAVILVDGCGGGARAHPCEATASGLLSLGSSPPSTSCVGGVAGPGLPDPARLDISLLPTWCLVLGPCFLVRRLPMGWAGWGSVYVSTLLDCCLCYFLEILDFISWGSLVPSFSNV